MTNGPDKTPILAVEDLSVDIPVPEGGLHAVRLVSFTVHRGETFCLVGESGCGKSITALDVNIHHHKRSKRRPVENDF